MNKLMDIEKKFKADKFFKEDKNRKFVMNEGNSFLQAVSTAATHVVEESKSSDSSPFENKQTK